jgi:hypothetical protein
MANAQVVCNAGCASALKAYFNNVWPAGGKNLTLKLFATSVTPTATSTAGSFTEAAGGGYAAITPLTNGSWTESNVGGIEQAIYAQQTFTFTGALTTNPVIYGYYIVDADGVLVTAQLLDAPFTPANNGDNVKVTPKVQLSHGTPSA